MAQTEDTRRLFAAISSNPAIIDELLSASGQPARQAVLARHGVLKGNEFLFDRRQVTQILKTVIQTPGPLPSPETSLRPISGWDTGAAVAAAAAALCVAY
jgi:hypothetical protein